MQRKQIEPSGSTLYMIVDVNVTKFKLNYCVVLRHVVQYSTSPLARRKSRHSNSLTQAVLTQVERALTIFQTQVPSSTYHTTLTRTHRDDNNNIGSDRCSRPLHNKTAGKMGTISQSRRPLRRPLFPGSSRLRRPFFAGRWRLQTRKA